MNSLRSHRPERGWKQTGVLELVYWRAGRNFTITSPRKGMETLGTILHKQRYSILYDHIAPKGDGNAHLLTNSKCVHNFFTITSPRKGMETRQVPLCQTKVGLLTLRSHRPERGWKQLMFAVLFPEK